MPEIHLPGEMASLSQWTIHIKKRPVIPPDKAHEGKPYAEIMHHANIGLLLSPHTPLAVIDVDFNGSRDGLTKAELKQEKQACMDTARECGFTEHNWSTPEYLEWLRTNTRVLQQMDGTELFPLLQNTYVEFSPSGLGFHIWLNIKDKNKVDKAYKASNFPGLHGQLSLQNCFMTVTRLPVYGCKPTLATLFHDFAPQCFNFKEPTPTTKKSKTASTAEPDAIEQFTLLAEAGEITEAQVVEALALVPCDSSRKVQQHWNALTGNTYCHHDFWLAIGMALHDYGLKAKCLPSMFIAWLNWSKKDKANFEGEESVEKRWRSFSSDGGSITIATLLAMAARMKFEYPRPIYKDGKPTAMPWINEYVNFSYLMKYYNIKMYEDDLYYLTGDEETMRTYFARGQAPILGKYYGPFTQSDLVAGTLVLCQDSHWRKLVTTNTLVQTWISLESRPLDLFKTWMDTPYEKLPEETKEIHMPEGVFHAHHFDHNSTVDYLFNCLNAQYETDSERDLYFTMFKKWLMQIIKFREPEVLNTPFVDNGGILILSGAENTFKSTFCKLLVPRQLDSVRKEINTQLKGEKSFRDFLRYFSTKAVIQVDEFESVMDISSSFFKNLLSSNDNSFVDIFSTQEKLRRRKAVIIGTTNKNRLVMSEDGTRRLWFIPVGKIDTSAMLRVNLHKLYNDLREEFRQQFKRGVMPWLLTQDEIDTLNVHNQAYSARSDIDLILEEIWPIGAGVMPKKYLDDVNLAKGDSPKCLTSAQVRTILHLEGYPNAKPTLVEHALRRHCTRWTGLSPGAEATSKSRVIKDGKLNQNWDENQQRYFRSKWIMPPRAKESD